MTKKKHITQSVTVTAAQLEALRAIGQEAIIPEGGIHNEPYFSTDGLKFLLAEYEKVRSYAILSNDAEKDPSETVKKIYDMHLAIMCKLCVMFAKKHEIIFTDYVTQDLFYAEFGNGDYIFSIVDILQDLMQAIEPKLILEWYDDTQAMALHSDIKINFSTYVAGLRY
jgi:hypothetical protein